MGAGGLEPPYPHRSFGAPLKPPQQFLNLDEEEEGEERRKKKRKKEKRKKKGRLSPPFLDLLDPPLLLFVEANTLPTPNGKRYEL